MRGRVLHISLGEAVREHRTPAYKLVLGVDAELALCHAGRRGNVRAVLVPPGTTQSLTAHGLAVGVFMAAGSELAPYLAYQTGAVPLRGSIAAGLVSLAQSLARSDGSWDHDFADEAFRMLGLRGRRPVDARAERSLRSLQRAPNRSLQDLASAVRLSPDRLRHLVAQETGMPLSEHRLLQRTTLAIERLLGGASIAAAACAAGFADHAHFTRTFGRLFGRTPSSVPACSVMWATWAERGDARLST
jgi:AraC-like DNA-binding protein